MQALQIIDKRQLTFERGVVTEALRRPSEVARRLALPQRAPDFVKLVPDRGQVELIYGDSSGPERRFRLSYEQVVALLIDFCRRSSIPLPRRSTKSIVVEGEALVLCCVKAVRI